MDTRFSLIENISMQKRRCTSEFKKEAVRLMIIDALDTKAVSEQLGVNRTLLYNWKAVHLDELERAAGPESASPKEMAEEIAQLRKALAKEQRVNQILKKTVGYFAKED